MCSRQIEFCATCSAFASHRLAPPPWGQPRGKWMVSLVNSHTNATRIGWHLWEIDLRFAPGLPPGWLEQSASGVLPTLLCASSSRAARHALGSTAGGVADKNQVGHPRALKEPRAWFSRATLNCICNGAIPMRWARQQAGLPPRPRRAPSIPDLTRPRTEALTLRTTHLGNLNTRWSPLVPWLPGGPFPSFGSVCLDSPRQRAASHAASHRSAWGSRHCSCNSTLLERSRPSALCSTEWVSEAHVRCRVSHSLRGTRREGGPPGSCPPSCRHRRPSRRLLFFFTLVTGPRRSLSLKLSDTRVYAPQMRARLGTTAQQHKSS